MCLSTYASFCKVYRASNISAVVTLRHVFLHVAVPSAVEGLTLNVTGDEFMIRWDSLVGVVSHYAVIIRVNGKELQFNVTGHNFSLETENLSEDGTIEVNVRAVNDAGIGPSATVTIEPKHMQEQGKYS